MPSQPVELPLFRAHTHRERILADSSDRAAWLRARSRGITATDVAALATPKSVRNVAYAKLHGTGFVGNAYTQHGIEREPVIAQWVQQNFGIAPSTALFHAEHDLRHLATPDGLRECADGTLELAEIKTTAKLWRSVPRNYLRQVWWQQYVLGAERTLLVWERHENFVPVGNPEFRWIERDDEEIEKLLGLVDELIHTLIRATSS